MVLEQWVGSETTGQLTEYVIGLCISPRSVTGCIPRRQCTPGDIALLSTNKKKMIRGDLKISAWPLTALKLLTVSQSRL